MDLDLRKLRYFAAVAEHGHFGRAAQALFIAQPVLSRQVRALEQEIGCDLLERTTRTVSLTPAGAVLHEEAQRLFAVVDSAVRRVQQADRGLDRLVVGFVPGLHVSGAVRSFGTAHPDTAITLLTLNWWEQDAALRDGRVDVAYLRGDVDPAGLKVVRIGSEPTVACLPSSHPLARRRSLRLADLDHEEIFNAHARRTASVEEKFELIAAGHGIALVPRSVARSYPRPDLTSIPVRDLPEVDISVAVLSGRPERPLRDFVRIATSPHDAVESRAENQPERAGRRSGGGHSERSAAKIIASWTPPDQRRAARKRASST